MDPNSKTHICLLPCLHFRKPMLLMPGEPRELLHFIFLAAFIIHGNTQMKQGDSWAISACHQPQAAPRAHQGWHLPSQKCSHYLPSHECSHYLPTASGMQLPISCSASYSLLCMMFCQMSLHGSPSFPIANVPQKCLQAFSVSEAPRLKSGNTQF